MCLRCGRTIKEEVAVCPGCQDHVRCAKCGYHLRGLAREVCPECGVEARVAERRKWEGRQDRAAFANDLRRALLTVIVLILFCGCVGPMLIRCAGSGW